MQKKVPLIKKPCESCPFRTDVTGYITKDRATEIKNSLIEGNGSVFPCHKTINYNDDTLEAKQDWGGRTMPCAGACVLTYNELGDFNGVMQIGERLRLYSLRELDFTSPVFESFDDFIEAQI